MRRARTVRTAALATAGRRSAPIERWDTMPVRLNDTSAFRNLGTEPLELLVYGVSKDLDTKTRRG
jgi:hypothetical protein